MEQIKKTAEKVLKNCLGAKPGEVLLIVTDNTCGDIAGALYESGKDLGCEAVMMTMAELKVNGQEPPEIVAQAMKSADIVICPTAKSLTHTNARIEAVKNGARVATMPGITADMFLNGAMTADYNAVEALTKKVVALLSEASVAVIEKDGHRLTLNLAGRPGISSSGIYREPGQCGNLPSGEGYIAPLEDGTCGDMIIDGSMVGIGKLDSPLLVKIKDGKLQSIQGEGSEKLDILLKNERNATVGELGIGTNTAARLTVAAPELVEMDCNIGVKGEGFEYVFGRGKGLVSIRYNGVQLLDDTVRPNFWRAPTNNDEGCAEPFAFAFWKTAGLYARCDNLTAETKGDFVIARANYTLPDGQTLPIDFAIDGAGRCDITMTWQGEHTELPEFGLLFPLRRELTEVSYLGLGPRETTADRTAGGKMGAWSYNVRQDFAQNTPVYPQECGSRTGVYSATVTGSGLNIGIGFAGDGMTFSALPYTPHELENARHLYELPRDDNKTVVRCAAFQRGVGGDNSWGAKPHADACFAVEKGTSFRFTIQK